MGFATSKSAGTIRRYWVFPPLSLLGLEHGLFHSQDQSAILLGHLISYNRYLTPSSFAPTTTTAIWVALDFGVNLVYWMQTCSNRPLHRLRAMPNKEDWLCLLCVCDRNQYISSCVDFFFRLLLRHPSCFVLVSWLLGNTS